MVGDTTTIIVGVSAAPFIVALMQIFKPFIPARFWQLLTLALGIGWNVGFALATDSFTAATVFVGISTGLAANGLYEGTRDLTRSAPMPTPPPPAPPPPAP